MTGIVQTLIGSFGAAAAAVTDAYFYLVTLLLPGNGTNGAQNNTFLDSSTNNFTITRNGSTTQGTFSPFSQTGWGNYFNGSSDYLTAPAGAAFAFGTGDFSVEAWVYLNATATSQNVIASTYASTSSGFTFSLEGTGVLKVRMAGDTVQLSGGTVVTANTWHHVMVSRVSGTLRLFLDGAVDGSVADSTNSNNSTTAWNIGRLANASGYFAGYISNHRVIKGSGTSAAFTPSTTPLTAITNTQLLTCQSNRFVDNSSNAFALTVGGSPSVQAFSPFAPTAAYSAATNGGSGYFDGNGDYLNFTGTNFNVGTGAFTLEGWIYMTTNQYSSVIATWNAAATGVGFLLGVDNTGKVQFSIGNGNTGNVETILSASAIPLNSWVYLAATKAAGSGGTMTLYVNGTSVGTTTTTRSVDRTAAVIGRYYQDTNNYYLTGYLADVRVSNTVRTISVPTAPLTSDGNTLFLASYTNAGITDATAKNDLETVGGAQISTTQSKFGGSSMYFDGTGDRLVAPTSQNTAFRTGDFTIEFWAYPTSSTSTFRSFIDTRSGSVNTGISIWQNGTSLEIYGSAQQLAATSALTVNAWQHIAVTRASNTVRAFVNGTQVGSSYTNSNDMTDTRLVIADDNTSTYPFVGYLDDFRITKGYARYTANFTAPTAAFALQ